MADEVTLLRARSLAPWAQTATGSRGREVIEEPPAFHDEFSFDTAKILASRAWEKLGAKFLCAGGEGPSFAQIAMDAAHTSRLIARVLHCNEELAVACALAKFLGTPPGGYTGRRALEWIMRSHGGFSGDSQALRIVEEVEVCHPEYNGLNLTWETREAVGATRVGSGRVEPLLGFAPNSVSLEAQIAAEAVRCELFFAMLGLCLHLGLVYPEMLSCLALWQSAEAHLGRKYKRVEERRSIPRCVEKIRERLLEEVCRQSLQRLEQSALDNSDSVRKMTVTIVKLSNDTLCEVKQVAEVLRKKLFHDAELIRERPRQMERYNQLFTLLLKNPVLLGPHAYQRLRREPAAKVVCDQLCLLSDRELETLLDELLGKTSGTQANQAALAI